MSDDVKYDDIFGDDILEEGVDIPIDIEITDFVACLAISRFLYLPNTGICWRAEGINARFPKQQEIDAAGDPVFNAKGKPVMFPAATWLTRHNMVMQVIWAPGLPQLIDDQMVHEGGWIARPGVRVLNLYKPPTLKPGDAAKAGPWLDHVRRLYPDDAEHTFNFFAHRVQYPGDKINHALVLGGAQGIGKDTILVPVRAAVGIANFKDITAANVFGNFNGYVKAVLLRISELHDLGEANRFAFYQRTKPLCAAPPELFHCNEKNIPEYSVFNVVGTVMLTNHRTDGLYLPPDDRRHYVAWSNLSAGETGFTPDYFIQLNQWFEAEGNSHVYAYLKARDLSAFDPKAPPRKTEMFQVIIGSNQSPETPGLLDLIEALENPKALTIFQLIEAALTRNQDLATWLTDLKNRRPVNHRLSELGYTLVRNPNAKDGLWWVAGRRSAIYALDKLTTEERSTAAEQLVLEIASKAAGNVTPLRPKPS
jgi:hypothetical protein